MATKTPTFRKSFSTGMMLVGNVFLKFTVGMNGRVLDRHGNIAAWPVDPAEKVFYTVGGVISSVQHSVDKGAANSIPASMLTRSSRKLVARDLYEHTMWMATNGGRLDIESITRGTELVAAIAEAYGASTAKTA